MSKMTLWVVSGSFLIPGTREKGNFGPVRIADSSKQQASKYLAPMLQDKFRKELARANRQGGPRIAFGDSFAMMNLKWEEYRSPIANVPIPVDDRNDPPSLTV